MSKNPCSDDEPKHHDRSSFCGSLRPPVLTADAEFRTVANAAFAAWRQQPPYIAYRVDVDVEVPALKQSRRIERAVEMRTRDNLAVLQDLPRGQNQLGGAFPVPPSFDALSYFKIDFRLGDPIRQHNPLTAVTVLSPAPNLPPQPLQFSDPVPSSPDVTVVVTTLRNYYAAYAPDSSDAVAHIVMQPLPALTHDNDSSFYLKDVYVDAATDLPTRIVYSGPATTFTLDYAVVAGHWLVDHAFYSRTIFGPLHIGQTTFTTEASYNAFTFPGTPADPRLR